MQSFCIYLAMVGALGLKETTFEEGLTGV